MVEIGSLRLDDTPVNGQTERGVTSNWAYDEAAARAAADTNEAAARAAADTAHAANPDGHGNDIHPWTIFINTFFTPKSNVNWNTIYLDSNNPFAGYLYSSGAQNDEITWDIVLAKGTWSIELLYKGDTDKGIFSVYFDSDLKGTIDSYRGTTTYGVRSSINSINVPTTKKIQLKLKMETKNSSSSSYIGVINGIRLMRTA